MKPTSVTELFQAVNYSTITITVHKFIMEAPNTLIYKFIMTDPNHSRTSLNTPQLICWLGQGIPTSTNSEEFVWL